ncbi:MAG: elongation factor 1-beta [Nanoarchaeota archaeon]|nr:elongation factor 1-beta [Nanoarchaeota archaeon]
MADVVVTIKVLPNSPEINIDELGAKVEEVIKKFGRIYKKSVQPIAFGINALVISFIMPEGEGGTEPVEAEVKKIDGTGDVQVTDVTRIVDVNDL